MSNPQLQTTVSTSPCWHQLEKELQNEYSQSIPLYTGEIDKKLFKQVEGKKEARSSKKKISSPIQTVKEPNSYLRIFHSKIGYSSGSNVTPDTCRGTDGDLTFRTATSMDSQDTEVFHDAQAAEPDTESFYFDYLHNEQERERIKSVTTTSLTDRSFSKLQSVSEVGLSASPKRQSKKRSGVRKDVLDSPFLGSLGPDIEAVREKQRTLQKRQLYGCTVSQKNIIKITEGKLLKELKHEVIKN